MKSSEPNSPSLNIRAIANEPPLPKTFFFRKTDLVARDLLGKGLYVKSGSDEMLLEIVEVEAYFGSSDPASHAFRGPTKRNWPMFEEGGTCYVYLSYGVNYCMNVSTGKQGKGEAVLLRAGAALAGIDAMKKNRGLTSDLKISPKLTNGPGKLTQALGIDLTYNGVTFDKPNFRLVNLRRHVASTSMQIGKSPRIGISKATELELRFFVKASPWLSRK